jgi:hypothetical protein
VALKAVIAKLEDVAEPLREHYSKADDGAFVLQTNIDDHPGVAGLKSALDKERDERRIAKKKLKDFEALGQSPEQLEELLEARATGEGKKGGKEELENWKQQIAAKAKAEVDAITAKLAEAEGELYTIHGEQAARKALEGKAVSVDLMLPHVLKDVKVEKGEDGKYRAVVLGPDKKPRIANSAGQAMTVEDLVAEMAGKAEFAAGFKGSGAGGSGAGGQKKLTGNEKVIPGDDNKAFVDNIDAIAKGEVIVQH